MTRCCGSGLCLCRRGGAAPAVSVGNGLERLAQAVALYQGRFLGGFSLGDAPAFEEWQLLQRERLHRQAMDALGTLVERYTAQGAYEDALGYAWRQVELDPWREAAQRQLIHLLALTGQRGAALRQYEVCCGILEEELGVKPDQQTSGPDPGRPSGDTGRDEAGKPRAGIGTTDHHREAISDDPGPAYAVDRPRGRNGDAG